ncbi:YdbH domain-containing protein [Phenylobacterium sp.]|uniref:intermembrane phospholipid transport protein YdbH family protein n=1 Tax=Phenylobacterium sp. TaxID=1871053 RepID=UPI00286BCE90|nr:YdbH domain-containing protein [Phenylobacterium sp.]
MTEPKASPGRLSLILAAAGLIALVLLVALYAARRIIAREALVGWLRAHGVAATAQVRDLGLGEVTGRVTAGDPRAPDFAAGDATLRWGLGATGLEVRSVRLVGPTIHLRLRGGRASLGSLDPLIAELLRRPPNPRRAPPRVEIARGLLRLDTDYGPLRLTADATVAGGRLTRLDARSAPARLRGPGFDASLGSGALAVRTRGELVSFNLDLPATATFPGGLSATGARLTLSGETAYPDLARRRADGPVTLRAHITGALAAAGATVRQADLNATFEGRSSGGIEALALVGKAGASLDVRSANLGAATLTSVRATAAADDLSWSRATALAATPRLTLRAHDAAASGLSLDGIDATLGGPVRYGRSGLEARLAASLDSHGAWRGLGRPVQADAPQLAAIKRAASGFRIAAPAMTLDLKGATATLGLRRPLSVKPDQGGTVRLAALPGGPAIGPGGGRVSLTVDGGGLPQVTSQVRRLAFAHGGASADVHAKAAASVGPVLGGEIDIAGALTASRAGLRFTALRCALVEVRKLELGANDLKALSAEICPDGGPLVALAGGDWRIDARLRNLDAETPGFQARIAGGAGQVQAASRRGALLLNARLDDAGLSDTATSTRFNPLRIAGRAALAGGLWSAAFAGHAPTGLALGKAVLRHDGASGRGGLDIDTGPLVFAPGGAQPADLSPLAQAIGAPAKGEARFAGRLDWTSAGVTSGGLLSIPHLDFQSPAGAVTGLSGTVAFSSLVPLVAAPGQTLKIDSVATVVPLTGVVATFGLDDKALLISGGSAAVGGGQVSVESLSIPLVAHAPMEGALRFEGVQLHDLVAASPFGDKVDLDAVVSGRIPFDSQDGKVRILGGDLHAIRPGRLSIKRQALSGVAAAGSVQAPAGQAAVVPPTDTFTDFAYQALENLAFTSLDAGLATRPDGRLGTLFHIVGRHDPPHHQEIRLSLFDLIGRKFLTRPLPLPSDTAVDLTLDTTLNLDDLLADYADYQRLRGSRAVQAATPNLESKPVETPR